MASLRCLYPVIHLVAVLSGVILSVVIRRWSPHWSSVPLMLLAVTVCDVVIVVCHLLSLWSIIRCHHLHPLLSLTMHYLIVVYFFAVVVSSFAVAHHRLLVSSIIVEISPYTAHPLPQPPSPPILLWLIVVSAYCIAASLRFKDWLGG
jgi:hypothetical protein